MVWDVADPSRPVFSVAVPDFSRAALSPDGQVVYAVCPGRRSVRAYDVDSGRLLRSAAADRYRYTTLAGGTDVSPDGKTLAAGSGDRILRFDTTTLQQRGTALRSTSWRPSAPKRHRLRRRPGRGPGLAAD